MPIRVTSVATALLCFLCCAFAENGSAMQRGVANSGGAAYFLFRPEAFEKYSLFRFDLPTTPSASVQPTYTVRPGDNDVVIAKRLGVTPRSLRATNPGIVWTRLQIGTQLRVPTGNGAPRSVAKQGKREILNLPPLRPPLKPRVVKSPLLRYVVREGDNDWNIADRLAVRVSDLHRLNQGVDFARLKPGDVLYAPGPGRVLPSRILDLPELAPPRNSGPGSASWAMLDADRVGVRVAPSNSAQRITLVDKFTTARVIGAADGWYRLRFQHGTTGWVRGDMLVATDTPAWAIRRSEPRPRVRYYASTGSRTTPYRRSYASRPQRYSADYRILGTTGHSVVDYAAKFQGIRYRYGGESTAGFDCSGFTRFVYRKHGINLPHNAAAQMRKGRPVPKDQIRPGDLVFFRSSRGGSRIGHTGIAIGGGKFIHASSGRGRVRVDSYVSGHYSSRFAGAKTFRSRNDTVSAARAEAEKANKEGQKPTPAEAEKPAEQQE